MTGRPGAYILVQALWHGVGLRMHYFYRFKKLAVVFALSGVLLAEPVMAQNTLPTLPSPREMPADPGLNSSPDQGANEGALPQMDEPLRSPGLGIPLNDLGIDPFAETPDEELQAPVVEKTPEQSQEEIRQKAFDAAITGLLPLRPGEVRELLQRFDKVQQAVETPVYPYPKPEVVTETVPIDPGSTPAEIKVAVGHVTTLNILDASGSKWPITDITWAGNFDVVQPGKNGNVIRITPTSDFAYGNMAVMLAGLITPVTFIIKAHRDSVHYRFDARIPATGPLTEPPLIEGGGGLTMTTAGDGTLSVVLDGIMPQNAKRLYVTGADNRTTAYRVNETTYLRTPLTLLSPGWARSVSSADGMNVYALANAPVLLLSDQGKMIRARLNEEKPDDTE